MIVQSVLAGFANTDCYELVWPDTLHQSAKGDIEKLLDLIMWASQQAAMFMCLPVALLHLKGGFLAAMRIVILGELSLCLCKHSSVSC